MTLRVYNDLVQGSEEWLAARRGIVTASIVGQLISTRTPDGSGYPCPECGAIEYAPCISRARKEPTAIKTLHATRVAPFDAPLIVEPSTGDTARALTALLVAERITGWSDPVYVTADMERGNLDEPIARAAYAKHTGWFVDEAGFLVHEDEDGCRLGYSPDGLVSDNGLIEIKSRRAKKHLATILADEVPIENMAQIQAGLLVTGRDWCDYVSFCGGMPLWIKRVHPDVRWFDAIVGGVHLFEENAADMHSRYLDATRGLPATERINYDLAGIEF